MVGHKCTCADDTRTTTITEILFLQTNTYEMTADAEKKKAKQRSRNRSSTMQDECEEYSSLNKTTKNSSSQGKLVAEKLEVLVANSFRCLKRG